MKNCCSTFKERIGNWVGYDPIYRQYFLQKSIEDGPFVNCFDHFSDEEKKDCYYEEVKPDKFYTKSELKKSEINRILLNACSVVLDFCPWCGEKLPPALDDDYPCALLMEWGNVWKSKYPWWYRSHWNEICLQGPKNPFPRGFPKEFKSDAWWKNRGLETKEGLRKWRKHFNEWLTLNPEAGVYCCSLDESV